MGNQNGFRKKEETRKLLAVPGRHMAYTNKKKGKNVINNHCNMVKLCIQIILNDGF